MAVWTLTKAQIRSRIEAMIRAATNKQTITGAARDIVDTAINMCIHDLSTDPSVTFKCLTSDTTASCTAGTNYVDLSSGVIEVIDGTVRIVGETVILTPMTLEAFYRSDVGENSAGPPKQYAIDTSSADIVRLRLRPIPDSAYTIALTLVTLPDEDGTTSFPDWMTGLVMSGSAMNAFEMLSLDFRAHERRYEKRLQAARNQQEGRDGPHYVRRTEMASTYVAPELRATDL